MRADTVVGALEAAVVDGNLGRVSRVVGELTRDELTQFGSVVRTVDCMILMEQGKRIVKEAAER